MDCVAVFLLMIFATTQAQSTSFQYNCNNSDVFMPGSGLEDAALASGVVDLEQLQYCYIDNCTIMRIDTEQQLTLLKVTL